jgi:hypothetical protein
MVIPSSHRNIVLLVGATGSLGRPLVEELEPQNKQLRLLGRSRDTFERAGLLIDKRDIVFCDTTNLKSYKDEWFQDVRIIVSMARPRSLQKGDLNRFGPFVESLCEVACRNEVPKLVFLGLPYVEQFVLGKTNTTRFYDEIEQKLRQRVADSKTTFLTILRINETSELGHLMEMATYLHFWPHIWGYDPVMQPMSANDCAKAMAAFCNSERELPPSAQSRVTEYLVGGQEILKWTKLGRLISSITGLHLVQIPIPLVFLWLMINVLGFLSKCFPEKLSVLSTIVDMVKIATVPMLSNTRNDQTIAVGEDRVEDVLRQQRINYVREKVKNG